MDPVAITWVIDRINWLIARLSGREETRTKERSEAIAALIKALNETRIHFGTQRTKRKRNRPREEEISRLWIDAAVKVRPIDDELANRCESKGRFWADPAGFDDRDIDTATISIEAVEASLRKLQ